MKKLNKRLRRYLIVQRIHAATWHISHTEYITEESGAKALKKYAKSVLGLDEEEYKIFLKSKLAHTVCYNSKNLVMIQRLKKMKEQENWQEELKKFLQEKKSKTEEKTSQPELNFI